MNKRFDACCNKVYLNERQEFVYTAKFRRKVAVDEIMDIDDQPSFVPFVMTSVLRDEVLLD